MRVDLGWGGEDARSDDQPNHQGQAIEIGQCLVLFEVLNGALSVHGERYL